MPNGETTKARNACMVAERARGVTQLPACSALTRPAISIRQRELHEGHSEFGIGISLVIMI